MLEKGRRSHDTFSETRGREGELSKWRAWQTVPNVFTKKLREVRVNCLIYKLGSLFLTILRKTRRREGELSNWQGWQTVPQTFTKIEYFCFYDFHAFLVRTSTWLHFWRWRFSDQNLCRDARLQLHWTIYCITFYIAICGCINVCHARELVAAVLPYMRKERAKEDWFLLQIYVNSYLTWTTKRAAV